MADHPCKQLKEEMDLAIVELDLAQGGVNRFRVTEPLDPIKDVVPIDGDALQAAHDRLEKAEKAWREAEERYYNCVKLHGAPKP